MKMLDGIPLNISDFGGWALLVALGAWLLRAIVRGDLVPGKTVDRLTRAAERRDSQVESLIEGLGTALHWMEEVATAAKRKSVDDDAEAGP